jgi:hypothetical protein
VNVALPKISICATSSGQVTSAIAVIGLTSRRRRR